VQQDPALLGVTVSLLHDAEQDGVCRLILPIDHDRYRRVRDVRPHLHERRGDDVNRPRPREGDTTVEVAGDNRPVPGPPDRFREGGAAVRVRIDDEYHAHVRTNGQRGEGEGGLRRRRARWPVGGTLAGPIWRRNQVHTYAIFGEGVRPPTLE
jgi:hypothetical protein